MYCTTPGFPVLHHLLELAQIHVHWLCDAIQLSHPPRPLLLLPSIFPSFKVFSNESVMHIRWPKYWSFSFSISHSNECSDLIFFRTDWLIYLLSFLIVREIYNIPNTKREPLSARHCTFCCKVCLDWKSFSLVSCDSAHIAQNVGLAFVYIIWENLFHFSVSVPSCLR